MHANPIQFGLMDRPEQWRRSSYRFYEFGDEAPLAMDWDEAFPFELQYSARPVSPPARRCANGMGPPLAALEIHDTIVHYFSKLLLACKLDVLVMRCLHHPPVVSIHDESVPEEIQNNI